MRREVLGVVLVFFVVGSAGAALGQESTEYGPGRGALVIAGGGPLDESGILERFIELGGGASDGHFVIVPTAGGNRNQDGTVRSFDEDRVLARWRARGLRSVSMLHTHDPAVADTDEFIATLEEATAVWFNGGRQWNIVDSYAGTRTYEAMHDVLARGGVIGGSSAGATIQGEYLVRGDTRGSGIVMTDESNHQRGFEFLRRSAIDQHIDTRDRWDDIIPVIAQQPHLLGLGISESTAVVVHGDRFEVVGVGDVAVHDNTRDYDAEARPYFLLSAGDAFDMRERAVAAPAAPGPEAVQARLSPVGGRRLVDLGDFARGCPDDPHCMNRMHPAIPMVATVAPGDVVMLDSRNASDFDLEPGADRDPRAAGPPGSAVHPLVGPIRIEGARAGDVLMVRLLGIVPGAWGFTTITRNGLVTDTMESNLRVIWDLNSRYAESEQLPGVRIPNRSFPGIVTTLPGESDHAAMLAREAELLEAGGAVSPPLSANAAPVGICGAGTAHEHECLRTFPPRENGGNMDIRYLGVGSTIYLPCQVDGCGLSVGDLHYAQGDGEVAGTAIEMDATVMLTTELLPAGEMDVSQGPQYEGPATLLGIPSERFHATTGLPLKRAGETPPDLEYLEAARIPGLENLSKDIGLAARNALLQMIDFIVDRYGYSREQAFIIASVAVDLRIGQLVDAPNVGVTAILPLDIFER
ncbi:MAG: hypothetical protein GKS06_09540 [Acidobacteria bacterium]|nr:hypothetical protein [Acidobacteriota bacterium]